MNLSLKWNTDILELLISREAVFPVVWKLYVLTDTKGYPHSYNSISNDCLYTEEFGRLYKIWRTVLKVFQLPNGVQK